MGLVQILQISIILLVLLIMILAGIYLIITLKNKQKHKLSNKAKNSDIKELERQPDKSSVFDFMEFDEVKDNMIIRKNRKQYVMVVRCKGINYDLMSEEEKNSVEAGFVQFLNTLRFPIQLYVQTTSLNLRDIIDGYKERLKAMERDIQKTGQDMQNAKDQGKINLYNRLSFEKRRKENVLEYTADISNYIAKLSMNQNVLQQKNYVVVSYYVSELGNIENISKEELDNACFSELYTRTQTIIRSLASAGVVGKVLDSEELSELLYSAYNRDESEVVQLNKALDAEYDALYSTGKDILEKRQKAIDDMIEQEAVNLATDSITMADEKIKNEQKIMEKALEIVEEYKDQMSDSLYEKTKEEIKGTETPTKRGRPKKEKI